MGRNLVLAITIMIAVSACASEPTELLAGTDATAAAEEVEDTEEVGEAEELVEQDQPAETSTTAPATTEAPPSSESIPSTTGPAEIKEDDAPPTEETATTLPGIGAVEVIGEASVGVGRWAIFRPGPVDGDNECAAGELAFVVDGEVIHVYEDLAFEGGLRLFNGLGGQDAFVFNCEESVTQIAVAGSAVLPVDGWPTIDIVDLGDVRFEFLSDFAWYGDVFGGYGSHADGYDALFVNDPTTTTMVSYDSLIGERSVFNPDLGVSVLTPSLWTNDVDAAGETILSTTSNSRVQVWTIPGVVDDPLAEGDELRFTEDVAVRLWAATNPLERSVVGMTTATDWVFSVTEGTRVVRHVPRCSDTVVIESFIDEGDGSIDQDLPWLSADLVQVFDISDGC